MNCQDIAKLLDERDFGKLPAAERNQAATHLESCADCACEWQAFERVLELARPGMPAAYPARLWQALAQASRDSGGRRRAGRPVLLGALLLVGGAAAMAIWQTARESDVGSNLRESPTATPAAPLPEVGPFVNAVTAGDAEPEPASNASDYRIVVLPAVHSDTSALAMDVVEATRAAMLRVLRSLPKLEILEVSEAEIDALDLDLSGTQLPSGVRMPLSVGNRLYAVASHFGGAYGLEIGDDVPAAGHPVSGVMIMVRHGRESGAGGQGTSIDPAADTEAVELLGTRLATSLYERLFPEEAQAFWEAVLIDVGASEAERLEALDRIGPGFGGGSGYRISDEAVASAVDLARSSPSAETRMQIWETLGRIVYPAVGRPLTDALLYDRDARVREVAADYLYGYLPDPNVLAALEGASIGDASPVVRLRARWSLMSMRERLDYVERSLGDAGLAVEDRLAPLILSQQDYCYELSASGLVALREIAAGTGDRAMRIAALKEFGRSGQAEYLDPILDAIHNDPERPVQQAALAALQAHRDGSYLDDDSVYLDALLDVVGEHADPDLRRSAVSRLRRDLGTPAVREALEALVAREEDDSIRALIVEALRPADAATPGTGLPTVLQLQ